MINVDFERLLNEANITFSRSQGKGGQNVNKLETKAELTFNVIDSKVLDEASKSIILHALKSKLDTQGNLRVTSSSERYQLANKKKVIDKFKKIIEDTLKPKKNRLRTKATKKSKEARIKSKHYLSEKKKLRRKKIFE